MTSSKYIKNGITLLFCVILMNNTFFAFAEEQKSTYCELLDIGITDTEHSNPIFMNENFDKDNCETKENNKVEAFSMNTSFESPANTQKYITEPCIDNNSIMFISEDTCGSSANINLKNASFTSASGSIEFVSGSVDYKGSTPFVVYNREAHTPTVFVTDKSTGDIIDSYYYDVSYINNVNPGTGTVIVTFTNGYSGKLSRTFKIYMPPTTSTEVINTPEGIKIAWDAVENAKGYVIYRRAWNLVSSGWTTFERWNNTTSTEWVDTTVYAGTRYQYGIKAYYTDPMDNYNLGIVGPLKTTVRITSRQLNSVTSDAAGQMTVKWSPSKVFTGYQIKYASNSTFTNNVTAIKIEAPLSSQTKINNVAAGKTYYVTIRSYQVFEGMTYFGGWSNILSCEIMNSSSGGSSSGGSGSSGNEPSGIVYWTPNGEVYHLYRSCSTLKRSKTVLEGTLEQCPKSRVCNVCANMAS